MDSYLFLLENNLLNVSIGKDVKDIYYMWESSNTKEKHYYFDMISRAVYNTGLRREYLKYRKHNEHLKPEPIKDFECHRYVIKENGNYFVDKINNIVYLPNYYFSKLKQNDNDDIDLITIDNGIDKIAECTAECREIFDFVIKEQMCHNNEIIFNDFIKNIITLYINENEKMVSAFYGQQGQGKSFIAKVIGLAIQGKESSEVKKSGKGKDDKVIHKNRVKEFAEQNGFTIKDELKMYSRNKQVATQGVYENDKNIKNNGIYLFTANGRASSDVDDLIRQYEFKTMDETKKEELKNKTWEDKSGLGLAECGRQFLNYVFSFFDYNESYGRIERTTQEYKDALIKMISIDYKIEDMYNNFKGAELTADEFLNILIKYNIVERTTKQNPRLKNLNERLEGTGYKFDRKRGMKTFSYSIIIDDDKNENIL
jgi:hypothetical protein